MKAVFLLSAISRLISCVIAQDCKIDPKNPDYESQARACNAGYAPPPPAQGVMVTQTPASQPPGSKSSPTPQIVEVLSAPSGTAGEPPALPSDYGKDGALVGRCMIIRQANGYPPPPYDATQHWKQDCADACGPVIYQAVAAGRDNSSITCVGQGSETLTRGKFSFSRSTQFRGANLAMKVRSTHRVDVAVTIPSLTLLPTHS